MLYVVGSASAASVIRTRDTRVRKAPRVVRWSPTRSRLSCFRRFSVQLIRPSSGEQVNDVRNLSTLVDLACELQHGEFLGSQIVGASLGAMGLE